MQRSIFRIVGACGLIFTFTAAAQTAGSSGASSSGTASAAASGAKAAVSQGSTSSRAGVGVTSRPAQTINNANLTGANGQPTTTTATSPNAVQTPLPGQAPTTTTSLGTTTANTAGAANTAATTTSVPFNSLPAAVQNTITAQLPAGAQIGNVIQETTPAGTTLRAMVTQNGVTSEMALTGVPAIASSLNGSLATTTVGGVVPNNTAIIPNSGFVGTPFAFEQLPAGVQGAFTAQAAGAPVTNITFMAGPNGAGTYRGYANGQPIDIRTASRPQLAKAPAATNDVRVEDLPIAVRNAVKKEMPYAEITRIHKADSASGKLYDITLRSDNGTSTMQVSENGTIVRANRSLAADIPTPTPTLVVTNQPPKLEFATLPVAVRDTIETHVDPKSIKALILTNLDSKPAYLVDSVDRDGLRNRMYINKEGLISRTQTNIFGIANTGVDVTIGDLPEAARAAIEAQVEKKAITRIDMDMRGLTPVYIVSYARDGETRQMIYTPAGVRVENAVGAPAAASTGTIGEEPISLKGSPLKDEAPR